MALSNEERLSQMFWTVSRLDQTGQELPNKEKYAKLKELCGNAWHCLMGRNTNGMHWILGSSATSQIEGATDPWSTALVSKFAESRMQEQPRERRDDLYRVHSESISITSLLRHEEYEGPALASVYEAYAYTEDLAYSLRRYKDDFRAAYPELDKLISDIQGACFHIFTENTAFARAYLLHQLLDPMYSPNSPIREFLPKQHWHHHLHKGMWKSLKDLRDLHLGLARKENPSATDMVVLAFTLMGAEYHYEHQYKDLLKTAEDKGIELDVGLVRAAFDACLATHKESGTTRQESYSKARKYEHMEAIHGHDVAYQHFYSNDEAAPLTTETKGTTDDQEV